jgi:hypothetical protein
VRDVPGGYLQGVVPGACREAWCTIRLASHLAAWEPEMTGDILRSIILAQAPVRKCRAIDTRDAVHTQWARVERGGYGIGHLRHGGNGERVVERCRASRRIRPQAVPACRSTILKWETYPLFATSQ